MSTPSIPMVYSVPERHHYNDNNSGHILAAVNQTGKDILAAEGANTQSILNTLATDTLGLNNQMNSDTNAVLASNSNDTAGIKADTARLAFNLQDSNDKQFVNSTNAVERNGQLNYTATNANGVAAQLAISNTSAAILTGQERIAGENRALQYALNKDLLLAQKELLLSSEKSKLKIKLQAAENFAKIQELALQNKAALSMQMEECCCSLKTKISESAHTTREFIERIEDRNIRDANLALRLQLNALGATPIASAAKL